MTLLLVVLCLKKIERGRKEIVILGHLFSGGFLKLREHRKIPLKNVGWIIFIVECTDGTLYTGMARNLEKELIEINVLRKGIYFSRHPERLPVKVVFKEINVPFKEAYAKFCYMRKIPRHMRKKLISTKRWPMGGHWKKYIEKNQGI